jgi:hypothetical protein
MLAVTVAEASAAVEAAAVRLSVRSPARARPGRATGVVRGAELRDFQKRISAAPAGSA